MSKNTFQTRNQGGVSGVDSLLDVPSTWYAITAVGLGSECRILDGTVYIQPRVYRATPACHLEGSSTPSHAKDTETASKVKKIVMLGLRGGVLSDHRRGSLRKRVPPGAVICPGANGQQ